MFHKCAGCEVGLYCSRNCQSVAWKEQDHKTGCLRTTSLHRMSCPKYFVPHALLSITNLSFADSSQLPELSDVRYLAHRALDDFHIRFGRSEIKLPPAGFGVFVNYVQATNTEGVEIMGLFKLDNQDDNVYYPVHLNCGSAGPFEGLDRFIVMLKVQYAMGFATHSFIVKAEIEDSRNA